MTDIKSSIAYALGRAIQEEDDPEVRQELEELEERVCEAKEIIIKE